MQFDIEEFYPSISKGLLMKAINQARSFVTISKEEVKTIIYSRKSLLLNNISVWIKREGMVLSTLQKQNTMIYHDNTNTPVKKYHDIYRKKNPN